MGCSTTFSKIILFLFNIVFFLLGIASLGVGIWVAVNKNELFRFINLIDSQVKDGANRNQIDSVADQNGLVNIAGFVLIGVGAFTLLVGFCGCCGAFKESKCLLGMYAFLVGLVLFVEVAAAILAAVFQGRVRDATVSSVLALQDKYFVALPDVIAKRVSGANSTVTTLLNYVQIAFDCCGARVVGDIANSTSWLSSNRTWADGRLLQLPVTCCRLQPQIRSTAQSMGFDWVGTGFNSTLVEPNCPFNGVGGSGMNNQTCYAGLMDFVNQYAGPIIGVCVGIALFELFCIIVACCLVRAIAKN